jgi:Domain of unknown function (DUF5063)
MAAEFEVQAREYCSFIDGSHSYERAELVERLERHLVALYAAALSLPAGNPADQDVERMSHDEWSVLYTRLGAQLGDVSQYWTMSDPFTRESPVLGDLADDAADIYRDLMDGLAFCDEGKPGEAIWEWQSSFQTHWGRHAAEAMHALRVLRDRGGSNWV